MDLRQILTGLRRERDRLDQAIAALESLNFAGRRIRRRGRPITTKQAAPAKPRRRMSAAARRRIGQAKRQWWAERKKRKVA